MAKLNFGIATGRGLSHKEVAEQARVAEELGYTHIGLVDQPGLGLEVH